MRTSVLAQDSFVSCGLSRSRFWRSFSWLVGAALTAPFHRRFLRSMEPMTVHGEMGWKGLKAGQGDETVLSCDGEDHMLDHVQSLVDQ